ncbi:MAG: CinA family protein [Thermomicrobiales bacterium]|nr:CinA family protein [Thermomicrobiales bacterium]MCO5220568.1 CinA family protein [Thermomicrobiales bacterium]
MTEAPEIQLNRLLAERSGPTLGTAESCTGGTVASRIASISGSSAYFLGSVVSYSNSVKHNVLGVSHAILEEKGAVSFECARAMAAGARTLIGADIAVSTTGIAGPTGGTARKPVGLVYIGIATPIWLEAFELHFEGDRARIIDQTAFHALTYLLEAANQMVAAADR